MMCGMWEPDAVLELARARAAACGVHAAEATWVKTNKYLELLKKNARVQNLVGRQGASEMADHVVEALACSELGSRAPELARGWLDVGSGGGLPGVLVAASDLGPLVLMEPRARRAAFLELCLAAVGRPDVPVRRERVRTGASGPLYGVLSARAVFGLAEWLDIGSQLVVPGGWVLGHSRPGASDPPGISPVDRVSTETYEIRAYVPRGTDG